MEAGERDLRGEKKTQVEEADASSRKEERDDSQG